MHSEFEIRTSILKKMEQRTCEGCHEKDAAVELRQNDLLMCDLCWGRPMSEDSIIHRNTLIMEDVDTGVLEKSPIVVKCVKLLTDDEAVPAILDVATPSAVEVKEQIKDNNEDNNASNDTDDENEPKLLDTEDEDTLTEDESFQQTQKDQQQECEPASSRKSNMADHDWMIGSGKDKGTSDDKRFIYSELVKNVQIRTTKANRTQFAWLGSLAELKNLFKSALDIEGSWSIRQLKQAKSKRSKGKPQDADLVHTFCATDYNLTAIWCSNGTLQLQGTYADTVKNEISALIRSKTSGEPDRETLSKVAKLENDLLELRKLVLELRDDKFYSEQLVSVTERTDQPKITDFFKPVSPEVHELATNRAEYKTWKGD